MFCRQTTCKGFRCHFSWMFTSLGLMSTNFVINCFSSHFSRSTFGFLEGQTEPPSLIGVMQARLTACSSSASGLGGNRSCAEPVLHRHRFKSVPTSAVPQESGREAGCNQGGVLIVTEKGGNSPGLFLGQDLRNLEQFQ